MKRIKQFSGSDNALTESGKWLTALPDDSWRRKRAICSSADSDRPILITCMINRVLSPRIPIGQKIRR